VVLLHDSELLALKHYSRISTGSCLTTILYSPDLTPRDYHLFTYLKNWMGSQHFKNNEEYMKGVKTWLSSQAAGFFDGGI
jgi:hypothetical protein